MATKVIKKSRSNVSQAPENLPSRRESAKNGNLNPDAPLTEMQRQFVVYLVDHGMTQTAAARAAGPLSPGLLLTTGCATRKSSAPSQNVVLSTQLRVR